MKNRTLKAHSKLLIDVIERQAGTLKKAMLEGVMNAVEAGSSEVRITFIPSTDSKPARLQILDSGMGFRSQKEIEDWFETFGHPHSKREQKKWARFRMGRGQIFAFGKNVWRTGEFRMTVDIKKVSDELKVWQEKKDNHDEWLENGKQGEEPAHPGPLPELEYIFESGLEPFQGCCIDIELYNDPLRNYDTPSVDAIISQLRQQVEFIGVPVYFNDIPVSHDPMKLKWDFEDDNAYYLFGKGRGLAIYNMGAFVYEMSAAHAGLTGVVVSKKILKVNFARNEIHKDCPVWTEIEKILRKNRIKKARKSPRKLNANQRLSLLADLRDGTANYQDVKSLSLIPLTNNKIITLDALRKTRIPWTFAEGGDMVADRLLWNEQAVCIDSNILDELDYTGDEQDFFNWLLKQAFADDLRYTGNLKSQWAKMRRLFSPFAGKMGLSDGISRALIRLPENKWTKAEKRVVRALEKMGGYLQGRARNWGNRTICIGSAQTALAWTDGKSFICLTREYLKRLNLGAAYGCAHLVAVMFHELAHDDSTEETHHHSFEYYKAFHDLLAGHDGRYMESPIWICSHLAAKLKQLRTEDWNETQIRKEKKSQAARQKALGIDKSVAAKEEKPVKVKTPPPPPFPNGSRIIKAGDGTRRRVRRKRRI